MKMLKYSLFLLVFQVITQTTIASDQKPSSDQEALALCEKDEKARIVVVYPQVYKHEKAIKAIVARYGKILYEKSIWFRHHGPFNYIQHLYRNHPWFGVEASNAKRVKRKITRCFPPNERKQNPTRVYLVHDNTPSYHHFRVAKDKVRHLFNLTMHAIHSDHRHPDAVLYARAAFSENTIKFFNKRKPSLFSSFESLLKSYQKWIEKSGINAHECCVTGIESIKAAYGIHDCKKLEFIYTGNNKKIKSLPKNIVNISRQTNLYRKSLQDIVSKPQCHFYYKGLKFAYPSVFINSPIADLK